VRLTRRSVLRHAAGVVGAAALGGLAFQGGKAANAAPSRKEYMARYKKVILIGMDGLDPRLVKLLIAEGTAPAFARLWNEGSGGELQTVAPVQSPVVWTSMATGRNPGEHGVYDFIHRDPETYRPYLSITQSEGRGPLGTTRFRSPRHCPAIWNVLSDHGVPVTVIRWPVTFPPDRVRGRMLSGLGTPDITGGLGRYTLHTDDPSSVSDVPPESLVRVESHGSQIETVIRGPVTSGLLRRSRATVPLAISWRRRVDGGVTIEVGGEEIGLSPGSWSEWVRIEFSTGLLGNVPGMVKFRLLQREPVFRLYMTAVQIDPRDPALPLSSPGEYAPQLAGEIGPYYTQGMPEDTKALGEGCLDDDAFIEQCNGITRERLGMFWREFGRFREGLLACVFDTSDRVQHMFWRENSFDPRGKVVIIAPPIRDHYLEMDRFLGDLLGNIDSETALLVVSDHGFTSFDRSFDLNAWLVAEGLMALNGDPADVPDNENGLYRLVDWDRTKAYGCGFSSLYVNVRGREGNGIVDGDEAPGLVRQACRPYGRDDREPCDPGSISEG